MSAASILTIGKACAGLAIGCSTTPSMSSRRCGKGRSGDSSPMPSAPGWRQPLPRLPTPPEQVYADYRRTIAPYGTGNRHPRFFGWVHGAGNPVGMLAEMLAAGLNANLGGRDHAPIGCERQVIRWAAEMLGLPLDASGLLVTGTSIANFMAVLIARASVLGPAVREDGLSDSRLIAYASESVHGCIAKALDMAGLGTRQLHLVSCVPTGGMDLRRLGAMIREDRARGRRPFMVVGTAGSVDTGAIDDLDGLASLCAAERLWFHVDAAFGAIAMLSARLRPLFTGIERGDSVAFDFHKWAQIPYDAGCLMVRDAAAQLAAFRRPAAYLARTSGGLAAGDPWPCDLGPDLSRGFRALKVWMTLRTFGTEHLGRCVEQSCRLAQRLASLIDAHPLLERVAPAPLNIVCFRFRRAGDAVQAAIAVELQEQGIAAPSTTVIGGRLALRAAIVNHRTRAEDVDALVEGAVAAGCRQVGQSMRG